MSALAETPPPAPVKSPLATFVVQPELPERLCPTAREKRLFVAVSWMETVVELASLTNGSTFARRLAGCGPRAIPLVRMHADEARLLVPELPSARIVRDARELAPRDLIVSGEARAVEVPCAGATFTLGLHDVVRFESGGLSYVVRYVRPESSPKRRMIERVDATFVSTLLIALMAAFTIIRMIALQDFASPAPDESIIVHADFLTPHVAPPKRLPFHPPVLAHAPNGGVAHQGPRGAQSPMHGHPHQLPGNALAMLQAMGAGVEQIGHDGGVGEALQHLGHGYLAENGPGVDHTGALDGGGGPPGSLGIGENPFGPPGGPGHGELGLGEGQHHAVAPKDFIKLSPGMDKEVIRRIVRRHWNELRYCFEKELAKDPNLAGKVALAWTIGPVGQVVEAHVGETSLGSQAAEACMVANVRRWVFPAPKGGGIVNVTYPFIFETN